ncbi:MAG TPA: hypothetical protein VMC48_02215, partial [Methanobacterium sp.]|nr:hypothetical protein [Methanobacterium sp.]
MNNLNQIFRKYDLKLLLITVIFLLIVTDLSILLNIPFLKPVLAFIFFSAVPGFLILLIFPVDKLGTVKRTVLSVGISISFLMIVGLVLNILYPILSQPLSFKSVFVTLNLLTILLIGLAYWRNQDNIGKNMGFGLDLNGKLASPMLFPFLFPLLAVLGTNLMNTTQNNIILLTMLILIPVYLISVVYLRERIHFANYPLALWLIGLSLLLMHGLTSNHLLGIDVHLEYYS